MSLARTLGAALALVLMLGGCGAREPESAAGPRDAHAAAGRWTLDREGLLASVRKRFAPEGPDVVAREEAQARAVLLELELRADGVYGLLTTSLGLRQHIVGIWRAEGSTLRFYRQQLDGKPVEKETLEEAVFEGERIRLPFEESGLTFWLVRR